MDPESAEILARWRDGDQRAAAELVDRFTERLLALARSRLADKLARVIDPEDVVQSAYRSFFVDACDDRYVLRRSGDLWRLLAAITLHKLYRQAQRYNRGKRSIDRQQSFGGESSLLGLQTDVLTREPSPSEAAAAADELEHVMRELKPSHRQMIEMRLQGHSVAEIAAALECSERLVELVLERLRDRLRQRCQEYADR